ncbi:MAG: nuclear transport factor 2 family protein [Anaerolineales bacterium]|nr:nuclear transport factor 2 family protein [Anaerolineales bacterium]
MTLTGKGYYMWQLPYCDGADPARIAERAQRADLSHALIKIADGGHWDYNVDKERDLDLVPPVLKALHDVGIEVWGWHYVRGDSPLTEANQAIKRIGELNVDGYVVDAEQEYRDRDKERAAHTFMSKIRSAFPELPMALSSYRYPRVHRELPYDAVLEYCDYAMPQVYFEQSHNPVEQLRRSVDQYMQLTQARPVIPTAPTYVRGDWEPTREDLHRFLREAKESGLSAANAWSWDFATREKYLPLFEAVAEFEWPHKPAITDMPERLIGRLNQKEPAHVAALYRENAAHVTGARTVVGRPAVEAWYRKLLGEYLPEATFEVTGKVTDGATRQFTWRAVTPDGRSARGNDTLRIDAGRILYHYTFIRAAAAA